MRFTTTSLILSLFILAANPVLGHGTNPNHLRVNLISPYNQTSTLTSKAPTHPSYFGGDIALDIALGGSGQPVIFDFNPVSPATSVRGLVLSGGGNSRLTCKTGRYQDGGYTLEIEVQALYNGSWTPIGKVWYAHLANIRKNNWDYVADLETIADVGPWFDGNCSTNPHVHIELYDNNHYAGYVPRAVGSSVSPNDALGCIGSPLASDQPCP